MEVNAVPYDMPIIGKRVNVLRLYQAEGSKEAEKISGVLYPPTIRKKESYCAYGRNISFLRQQWEIYCPRIRKTGTETIISILRRKNSIQLNDTHPVFAIPELIQGIERERGILSFGVEDRKTGVQLYEPYDFA